MLRLNVTLHFHGNSKDYREPDGRCWSKDRKTASLHLYGETCYSFCDDIHEMQNKPIDDSPDGAGSRYDPPCLTGVVDCYGDMPSNLYDKEKQGMLDLYDTEDWDLKNTCR